MTHLDDLAAAISATSSPKIRAFALEAAREVDDLEARVAKLEQPTPPPVTGVKLGALRNGNAWNPAEDLTGYDLLVVSAANGKAAAGRCPKVAIYASLTDVSPDFWTCVDYTQAKASGWLVPGAVSSYGAGLLDPGVPAAKAEAILEIEQHCHAAGVNAVFLDDTLMTTEAWGSPIAPSSWQAMFAPFVVQACQDFHLTGIYPIVNAAGQIDGNKGSCDGTLCKTWWTQLQGGPSMVAVEYFEQDPLTRAARTTGTSDCNKTHAQDWALVPGYASALGFDFCAITYSPAEPVGYSATPQGSTFMTDHPWKPA